MIRAPRAYIAGFGTAGSLVAGVAVLFVLASAAVSFNGWPQLDVGTAPSAIVLASNESPTRSAATRRVATVLAAARQTGLPAIAGPTGASVRAATASPRRSQTPSSPGLQPALTIAPTNATGPTVTTPSGPPTPANGTPSCQSCGVRVPGAASGGGVTSGGSGAGSALSSTTGALGGVVSHLGSTLGAVTGSLGGRLGTIVPGAGNTGRALGRTGQLLGGALGSTTNTLGGAVAGTGHLVTGPLGTH